MIRGALLYAGLIVACLAVWAGLVALIFWVGSLPVAAGLLAIVGIVDVVFSWPGDDAWDDEATA